jgi:hypothetical protein
MLTLSGCVQTANTGTVQAARQRYTIEGTDEKTRAAQAQQFCREEQFDYAQLTDTGPKTIFYCMNNGEKLERSTVP